MHARALAAALVLTTSVHAAASAPIALTHFTVIDCTGGPALADRTVLISEGRIAEIGPANAVAVPPGAQVVDGSGRFLIPGLWDMHVHTAGKSYLPLYVGNGVVGVRDMHSFFWQQVADMRKSIAHGSLIGPHMVLATSLVDGPKPIWPGSLVAANADQGREAVRTLKKRGADFVKVYSKLPRDAYFAIADEARKQDLVFCGHVPETVTAAEASDSGQKSMEHLYGVLVACSSDCDRLHKELADAVGKVETPDLLKLMRRSQARAADTFDEARATDLFAHFVRNHTWQVPTLVVLRNISRLNDPAITKDERVKYMPPFIRNFWNPNNAPGGRKSPEDFDAMRRSYKKTIELVGRMYKAGVPIIAGTDATNPYVFPGFSLHDELALLVEAGLPPMAALQTATRNAADYLGELPKRGTIEKGKAADLVLLDADPLADIHNTRRIAAVVLNGKLFDRPALDQLLADAERGAR